MTDVSVSFFFVQIIEVFMNYSCRKLSVAVIPTNEIKLVKQFRYYCWIILTLVIAQKILTLEMQVWSLSLEKRKKIGICATLCLHRPQWAGQEADWLPSIHQWHHGNPGTEQISWTLTQVQSLPLSHSPARWCAADSDLTWSWQTGSKTVSVQHQWPWLQPDISEDTQGTEIFLLCEAETKIQTATNTKETERVSLIDKILNIWILITF